MGMLRFFSKKKGRKGKDTGHGKLEQYFHEVLQVTASDMMGEENIHFEVAWNCKLIWDIFSSQLAVFLFICILIK